MRRLATVIISIAAVWYIGTVGICAEATVVDEIILQNEKTGEDGLTIFGRVREVEKEKVWVIVTDGDNQGPISVPRNRIKRIEYDLDGRRSELPADDPVARYKFALWELSLGRNDDARLDLEAVVGKPGVPVEAFMLLAGLQEEAGELPGALAAYQGYLHANPTDQAKVREARAAVERLKPRVDAIAATTGNKPDENPANPVAGDNTEAVPVKNPPKSSVDEGLENYPKGDWSVVPWADPATITKEVDQESGNHFLAVNMSGGGKGSQRKTAIQLRVGRAKTAVIKSPRLIFYVYNPDNHSLPISVAFQTGRSMNYFESRTFRFNRKGWHTVNLDLNSNYFKSAKTDWSYKTEIEDKNDLKSLIILINTRRRQTVFLDYIKFTQ